MSENRRSTELLFTAKPGSDLDHIIQLLIDNPQGLSREDLDKIFPTNPSRGRFVVGKINQYLANAQVVHKRGRYMIRHQTPVLPTTEVNVITADARPAVAPIGNTAKVTSSGNSGLVFPPMPLPPVPMKNFVRPPFYGRMQDVLEIGRHVSMQGPPGIGKSTAFEQLAAELGMPLVNISGDAGLRRRDLTSTDRIVDGSSFSEIAEYSMAAIKGCWVKIDEINAADGDVILFLNSQLAPPYMVNVHGRQYPVHKDFRLCITYNPGLTGTKPLPPAFKDRFFPFKLVFPKRSVLRQMLEANGMPADWKDADRLMDYAYRVWKASTKGAIRYQITMRRLIDCVMISLTSKLNFEAAVKAAILNAIDDPMQYKVAQDLINSTEVVTDETEEE